MSSQTDLTFYICVKKATYKALVKGLSGKILTRDVFVVNAGGSKVADINETIMGLLNGLPFNRVIVQCGPKRLKELTGKLKGNVNVIAVDYEQSNWDEERPDNRPQWTWEPNWTLENIQRFQRDSYLQIGLAPTGSPLVNREINKKYRWNYRDIHNELGISVPLTVQLAGLPKRGTFDDALEKLNNQYMAAGVDVDRSWLVYSLAVGDTPNALSIDDAVEHIEEGTKYNFNNVCLFGHIPAKTIGIIERFER